MPFNRIAVYGHRGFANGRIVAALIASGAQVTALHRPSSDVSSLPQGVRKIAVDVLDESALGVSREHGFVHAIPKTGVKLFVPSDLGLRYGKELLHIPIIKAKEEL
ncbi:hypothetical protein ACHAQH_003641 [Verticillium albo-atrum]